MPCLNTWYVYLDRYIFFFLTHEVWLVVLVQAGRGVVAGGGAGHRAGAAAHGAGVWAGEVSPPVTAAPAPRLYVPPVGSEVKVFWVVLEVVLVKEVSQLLTRCKLDPTWAVDVDVPAASLLAVFTLLEFPDPAVG